MWNLCLQLSFSLGLKKAEKPVVGLWQMQQTVILLLLAIVAFIVSL